MSWRDALLIAPMLFVGAIVAAFGLFPDDRRDWRDLGQHRRLGRFDRGLLSAGAPQAPLIAAIRHFGAPLILEPASPTRRARRWSPLQRSAAGAKSTISPAPSRTTTRNETCRPTRASSTRVRRARKVMTMAGQSEGVSWWCRTAIVRRTGSTATISPVRLRCRIRKEWGRSKSHGRGRCARCGRGQEPRASR